MTIARRYLYETADAVRLERARPAARGRRWPSWSAKLVREERYHRMHIGAWLDRLARSEGEARDRLRGRAGDPRARRGHGLHATPRRGGPGRRRGSSPPRWPSSRRAWRASIEPTFDGSRPAAAMPPIRHRSTAAKVTAPTSAGCGASSRPCVRRTRERPGERGRPPGGPRPDPVGRRVAAHGGDRCDGPGALVDVMDPELPMVSIMDLGMVGTVVVGDGDPGRAAAHVRRLPGARPHPRRRRGAAVRVRSPRGGRRDVRAPRGRPSGSRQPGVTRWRQPGSRRRPSLAGRSVPAAARPTGS